MSKSAAIEGIQLEMERKLLVDFGFKVFTCSIEIKNIVGIKFGGRASTIWIH